MTPGTRIRTSFATPPPFLLTTLHYDYCVVISMLRGSATAENTGASSLHERPLMGGRGRKNPKNRGPNQSPLRNEYRDV